MFIVNKMLITNNVSGIRDSNKLIKKFVKPKIEKLLKSKKLSKSQNLAKSRKILLKSGNLSNFSTIKTRPSF